MIHVCIATSGNRKTFMTRPCYEPLTLLPNIALHVKYDNKQPLSDAYNYLLYDMDPYAQDDDIVLFLHDDVSIQCINLEDTLIKALSTYDIVGLAGSQTFSLSHPCVWHNSPQSSWSGSVAHQHPDHITVNTFGPYKQVIVLDGLFIATTVKLLREQPLLRWATYLPHYHFYDLDFSLTANSLGLTMGTIHCPVIHHSLGNYDSPQWRDSEKLFVEHWSKKVPPKC